MSLKFKKPKADGTKALQAFLNSPEGAEFVNVVDAVFEAGELPTDKDSLDRAVGAMLMRGGALKRYPNKIDLALLLLVNAQLDDDTIDYIGNYPIEEYATKYGTTPEEIRKSIVLSNINVTDLIEHFIPGINPMMLGMLKNLLP